MTTWTKNLTRFTSLMVALGLMLGLTVTGCSDDDREGGNTSEMVNIAYRFAQITTIDQKANLEATNVVLTAFDSEDVAVSATQDTQVIAEHKNVTEEEILGATIWEGNAAVSSDAAKLVLSYYDADGNEVATADTVDVANLAEGDTVNFAETEEETTEYESIKLFPEGTEASNLSDEDYENQAIDPATVAAGDTVTYVVIGKVASEDTEEEATAAESASTYESIEDATLTVEEVPEDETTNEDTTEEETTGKISALAADEETTEDGTTEDETTDENGEAFVIDGLSVTFNELAAGKTYTITATYEELNTENSAVVSVNGEPTTVTWTPAEEAMELTVGAEGTTVTATDAEGTELTVSITTEDTEHVTIEGNVISAVAATEEAIEVTATATDAEGTEIGTMTYSVTVVEEESDITWTPAEAEIILDDSTTEAAITATDAEGAELTVTLTTEDTEHVDIAENTIIGVNNTEEAIVVTATATDAEGAVVGTTTYSVTVNFI